MKSSSFAITAIVLLMMVAVFHHPVVTHHDDAQQLYRQITQLSTKDHLVHGALIAMLALLAGSLSTLDRRLGKPLGAYAAYGLGCALLGVAMLLDGFVVPRKEVRWLAGAGLLAAVPAAAMLSADLLLTPHTLMMIFAAHAVWYLAAAWTKAGS